MLFLAPGSDEEYEHSQTTGFGMTFDVRAPAGPEPSGFSALTRKLYSNPWIKFVTVHAVLAGSV